MDSKDAVSSTSSGSSSQPSSSSDSVKNSTGNSINLLDNDTTRTDDKGYASSEEEFVPALEEPVFEGKDGEGYSDATTVVTSVGGDSGIDEIESKGVKSGDEAFVESGNSNLVDTGGDVNVKGSTGGDSVGKINEVDAVTTVGVGAVRESDGNGDVVDKVHVGETTEADGEGGVCAGGTPIGDSVVDSIQVDVLDPGVAVVGRNEENVGDKDGVGEGGADDTPKGDSVVDTLKGDAVVDIIQVDVLEPGVSVVGEIEENGVVKADASLKEALNYTSTEPGVENKWDVLEAKPVAPENGKELDTETFVDAVSLAAETNGSADRSETRDEANRNGEDVAETQSRSAESADATAVHGHREIVNLENEADEEIELSEGDTDGMIFGGSEAAKKFIEELEQGSSEDSHAIGESSSEQPGGIDGQIVTDSEEGDSDDEGDGKELFDSAALAALLKAATGADPDSGNITITSQDGTRLFSVERPAGLGSSLRALRPAPQSNRPNLFGAPALSHAGGESEENLSEEEKKKLEKLQNIRVKFLRLVHRLGLSPEESVAAQVLYRLALLGGRQGTHTYSLDAAKRTALQLETEDKDSLDFSVNILVLGKSGAGKSATINSIIGEEKAPIDAFETGTANAKEISGFVNGVKVRVIDTPGLKTSAMEQSFNRSVLSSVKKLTKKSPTDVFLYVDRLDAQTRDLNDLPLLKTITGALGTPIWRNAIVTLTHAASAPPDGPNGSPLSYEVFVSQRSHVVQQYIGHAVGDLRMMSPSLMNPVSLVENHPSCRKNREGQKILPNGQSWRPQLLLLCYSMKILSEASSISKPQDPFDHRKLFGFRARSPPLPYMLSSMLQSRPHPKLPSDQGENGDSDIDLDELSDTDDGEEDEYDQLPPFKPLKKTQIAKLSKEQKKAYYEEYDYRVKLLQKKQWKEELRRIKELKKRGKDNLPLPEEEDMDSGAAAPVAVPLPDMALPQSFDGDNPAYRYRFLEPTSQFLARPVLDSHGWDHDCGYDGVNLEHSLAIANRFPVAYTVQITKDKKDFSVSLDSSVSVKHGENVSSMAGFDIQSMGKQLAYIFRGETKTKGFKKHKAAGGISLTFLGENVVPGVKIEDQITLGKQYSLVGSAGAVRSQQDIAYGANFELQRRELDYPIGQVQSTLSMSIIKWRGDLALGFNSLAQFSLGRNSKVAVRAGINNKLSGQVTVRTSSSDHLSLALAAVLPTALSIYKKFLSGSAGEKYPIY